MTDWLYDLPVVWMALAVFAATFLVAAAVYAGVMALAAFAWARAFRSVSPNMPPLLGIIFGLFVAFTAAQVWNEVDRANAAVEREASALSAVLFLASSFPGEPEARMRRLMHGYIEAAVAEEWPEMARGSGQLRIMPPALAEALQLAVALAPETRGQEVAQREIATALENVLDARWQRINVSRSRVNLLKWACICVQALCVLIAIAMVHGRNRRAAGFAMVLFAAGVAASVVLILSHDRPFIGEISVGPDALLQVMPEIEARQQ